MFATAAQEGLLGEQNSVFMTVVVVHSLTGRESIEKRVLFISF